MAFVVPIGSQDRRLCGRHAKIASRHPIPLCGTDHVEAELDQAGGARTARDDDVVRANQDVEDEELARQLSRTVWAVKNRRVRLRRSIKGVTDET